MSLLQAIESRRALVVLFVVGAVLRAILLPRPIDQPNWHECDLGGIARNYYREGMNPFYPRIDWRGNGPGYAEMEFPAQPWLMAVLYHVFGPHEVIGRILAFVASLGALVVFFRLASLVLPPLGAFCASLFFTLSPLAIVLSTAIQPEPFLLLGCLLAVFYFLQWLHTDSLGSYFAAMAATAAAILAKTPALHLGILFAALLLSQKGWRSLRSPRPWLFAIGALTPPLLWSYHAHKLWLDYRNSLGVSNEYHWVGLDLFTDPEFVKGLVRIELLVVWTPVGILLGCLGAAQVRTNPAARLALVWLGAALAFYVATIRTTSSDWAYYYHVASIAPAALLVGCAAEAGWQWRKKKTFAALVALAFVGTYLGEMGATALMVKKKLEPDPRRQEVMSLRPELLEGGLILVLGGKNLGPTNRPVAYNAPELLYWSDRKGFNVPFNLATLEEVRKYQDQSARYFIVDKEWLAKSTPDLPTRLRDSYPLIGETKNLLAFRLETLKGELP